MEGWKRVQYIMDQEGMNKNSFSAAIGINNNVTITRIINEKRNPSRATCQKIIDRFPQYRFEWLFKDEGDKTHPVAPPKAPPIESEVVPLVSNHIINVPLVNQYAQAGYLCGFQDADYMTTLPSLPFIIDHEAKGNYVAFEVRGDSMNDGTEDSYLEGDRLLCREIYPHLWVDSKLHIRKWDFVIVHEDGILVKRIIEHDVENHTITIHSLNDMYPDRIIDLAEVRQIFNVIELQRPRRR